MIKCAVKVDEKAKANRPQYVAADVGWRITEIYKSRCGHERAAGLA